MTDLFTRYGSPQAPTGQDAKDRPVWTHRNPCSRCGGAGRIDGYRHVEGGICFKCGGHGRGEVVSERLYTTAELEKLNATAAKRAATKLARQQREAEKAEAGRETLRQARAEALQADPFFQRLQGYSEGYSAFLTDLCAKMRVYDLSPAQVQAATEAMDKIDAHKARIATARYVGEVGARVEVTGAVEFVRCINEAEGYWDRSRYLVKIRTDDGQLLTWFTSSYLGEGERVIGKATVKEHSDYKGERQTVIKNPRWKEAA